MQGRNVADPAELYERSLVFDINGRSLTLDWPSYLTGCPCQDDDAELHVLGCQVDIIIRDKL